MGNLAVNASTIYGFVPECGFGHSGTDGFFTATLDGSIARALILSTIIDEHIMQLFARPVSSATTATYVKPGRHVLSATVRQCLPRLQQIACADHVTALRNSRMFLIKCSARLRPIAVQAPIFKQM